VYGWNNQGSEVITTNVKGEAAVRGSINGDDDDDDGKHGKHGKHGKDGSGGGDGEGGEEGERGVEGGEGKESEESEIDRLRRGPAGWKADECCEWWIDAAAAAVAEVRVDMATAAEKKAEKAAKAEKTNKAEAAGEAGEGNGEGEGDGCKRFDVVFAPKALVLEKVVSAVKEQRMGAAGRIGLSFAKAPADVLPVVSGTPNRLLPTALVLVALLLIAPCPLCIVSRQVTIVY
jgi:hypothetical protein